METEVVSMRVVGKWLERHFERPNAAMLVILFGGDRASCCDEAVVVKDDDQIVAMATISPEGEMHDGPAIVGIFVEPTHRHRGLGKQVLAAAIDRCVERDLVPVRIDAMSTNIQRTIDSLPENQRAHLLVRQRGNIFDVFDVG